MRVGSRRLRKVARSRRNKRRLKNIRRNIFESRDMNPQIAGSLLIENSAARAVGEILVGVAVPYLSFCLACGVNDYAKNNGIDAGPFLDSLRVGARGASLAVGLGVSRIAYNVGRMVLNQPSFTEYASIFRAGRDSFRGTRYRGRMPVLEG